MKRKSIGVYFTSEALQKLSLLKLPTESFSTAVNRSVVDCSGPADDNSLSSLTKKFITAFVYYQKTGTMVAFKLTEKEGSFYDKLLGEIENE